LVEVPVRTLEEVEPTTTIRSSPQRYGLWARTPVAAQPSAASVIALVSSSVSDTAVTVTIRGVTTTGVVSETKTLTGTTPLSTTASFSKILNVTLSTAAVGTVTLTSNSAAVTNLVLAAGEYGRSYQQLYLLDVPDSADVISYKFYRLPTPLVADNDLPDIPPPHADILVFDALLLMAGYIPDISKASLGVWSEMRDKLERSMAYDLLDGRSVAAQPRYIRRVGDLDDVAYWPHVHTN
jgi:hypothetical protein